MHPHIHCTLSLFPSVESSESLYHRLPLGMSRKCIVEVMTINVLKTGPMTKPEKLLVHGSLVNRWSNRG